MKAIIIIAIIIVILLFLVIFMQTGEGTEMREITVIIVHHSATKYGTVEAIDRYHRSKGWNGIGYHKVIYQDGSVHDGRPLSKVGAHAKGRNKNSIGICLIGKDSFTYEQRMALHDLCTRLAEEHSIKSIERHHEECPGKAINVEVLWEEIRLGI